MVMMLVNHSSLLLAAASVFGMAAAPVLPDQNETLRVRICGAANGQFRSLPINVPDQDGGHGDAHKGCHACMFEKKKPKKRQAALA